MDDKAHSLKKEFLLSEEGSVFLMGCCLLVAWIGAIVALWRIEQHLWLPILTFGFTQLFAGRSACVAYGTQLGFPSGLNVFLASYVDAMTVFIAYPVLVFGYHHVLERPFFQKHMKPVFDSAQNSLPHLSKYKIASVFVFVWFPFWMTGVVVGSVVGYLLGLKTWVNMLTVVLGTTSAALCWVLAYDRLYGWMGEIDRRIPLVVTVIIVVGLVVYRVVKTRRAKHRPAG